MAAHGEREEAGGKQRGREDGTTQRGTESSNLRRLQVAGEEGRTFGELPVLTDPLDRVAQERPVPLVHLRWKRST